MKIEIESTSNNPANTLMHVYDGNTRPLCSIYEEDFAEVLTERQLVKFENGENKFDVNKSELLNKAKTIF